VLRWVSVAAFLTAGVLVFDFITKGLGVVDAVAPYFVPAPVPRVNLRVVDAPGDGSCLEFAFSDLPPDFKLGDISLKIVTAEGPTTLAGDAAAEIITRPVNRMISPSVFRPNPRDITIPARIAATNVMDAAYVDFCPVLSHAGTGGVIWVMPTFHAVGGSVLSNLIITASGAELPQEGLPLSLAHPKYINVDLNEGRMEIIER
jgi:hypothetical protein